MMASPNLWENYYRTQESILTSATLHEDRSESHPRCAAQRV